MARVSTSNKLKKINEYYPFQKPIMSVKYDAHRQRIIVGGLDGQLKFFEVLDNELRVAYKIKLPSEIFAFDFSSDGNHYAMGLNDGSIIIKSKHLDDIVEQDEEEKLMTMMPNYKSTSKSYKYFYRGQYVMPDSEDLLATLKQRKVKLQPYENFLKKF